MTNIGSLLNKGFKFGGLYIGGDMFGRVSGMTINGNRESILIIQLEDEWFLVNADNNTTDNDESYNYYRCDQVEGLKKLLKDKGIIK